MTPMERLADELAIETLDIVEATGDDALIRRVAEAVANASQTMEEVFLTAVRIRRAERAARAVLAKAR